MHNYAKQHTIKLHLSRALRVGGVGFREISAPSIFKILPLCIFPAFVLLVADVCGFETFEVCLTCQITHQLVKMADAETQFRPSSSLPDLIMQINTEYENDYTCERGLRSPSRQPKTSRSIQGFVKAY